MSVAGTVRNIDIALKLLSKSRTEDVANLRPGLQNQRKESSRILIGALKRRMDRKSSLKWRTALEGALATGTSASCRIPIQETGHRILPRMAGDFLERGKAAAQAKASPEKLHAFRIAAKKFRYTLEIFAPVYGNKLHSWLKSIKAIQTVLGDINDCVTVSQILSDYKDADAAVGWLKKRQRRKADQFSRIWQEEFGDPESTRARVYALASPGQIMKKPAGRSRTAGSGNVLKDGTGG
jgi:CHAD domain-containing protein